MKLFRKRSIKIVFDALYGLHKDRLAYKVLLYQSFIKAISQPSKENMAIHEAIELIAYLHFDGKIEQGSKFESEMCDSVLGQIKKSDISHKTLALCWIFLLAYAREPLGQSVNVSPLIHLQFSVKNSDAYIKFKGSFIDGRYLDI